VSVTDTQRALPRLDGLGRERRMLAAEGIEVRAQENENEPIGFVGHAAVFNSRSLIEGWAGSFIEEAMPGSFRKTIQEADIRMLINHDANLVLARNRAGTLRLKEDKTGLLTDADMAPTSYARDMALSLERGDVSGMSIGFEVIKEEWDWDQDPPLRQIHEYRLWDVSVVTYPAFTETDAALRSAGFATLCRSLKLDKEQERRFLQHLVTGQSDPEFAPSLEAAGEALKRMAQRSEPATSHFDLLKLRHELNRKKFAAA
jgi:uncharacterized protein